MNNRYYIVFDYETDSPDPYTCNPTELAAIPVDPRKLEILDNHRFNVVIKPPNIDKEEYFTPEINKTIKWHAENRKVDQETIINLWKDGISQKDAWQSFCTYCKKFEVEKTATRWYVEPIPVGYNIINFDLIIAKRMHELYKPKPKSKFPLSPVQKVDIYDMLFTWFENLPEPDNLKMDTLRPFFQLRTEGFAHEALADVIDEAKIMIKFLNFQRRQAKVDKFKGAFANEQRTVSVA